VIRRRFHLGLAPTLTILVAVGAGARGRYVRYLTVAGRVIRRRANAVLSAFGFEGPYAAAMILLAA
jgi:hypothetical protein